MKFQLEEAREILAGTPDVMDALLHGKSDAWLRSRIDAQAFSPMDVLGHLIWGEMTDWIPRARMILECQRSRAFEPFDRRGFQRLIEGQTASELLSQFRELRRKNLLELNDLRLDEGALNLEGMHPELGPVTMRNLLATWVIHDLGHTAQIVRTMAREYSAEVGAWRSYLSILDSEG